MTDTYPFQDPPGEASPMVVYSTGIATMKTYTKYKPYPTPNQLEITKRKYDRRTESMYATLNRPQKLTRPASIRVVSADSEDSQCWEADESSITTTNAIPNIASPPSSSSSLSSSSTTRDRSAISLEEAELNARFPIHIEPLSPSKPQKPRRKPPARKVQFSDLPGEILEMIVQSVKESHLGKGSESCATCMMRDLCSVALCSRNLSVYAYVSLYEDIQLVGADSPTHKKKFKQSQGCRMALLRRTLRANPYIAEMVRSLKVPRPEKPTNWTASKGTQWLDQYEDLVAALVMACPNLERLRGLGLSYEHLFKRIFHALSTRNGLKEMLWMIEPSSAKKQSSRIGGSKPHQNDEEEEWVMPGDLNPLQEETFVEHHRRLVRLNRLAIHCEPGAAFGPATVLTRTFALLPALQHLHLCNLPAKAFNDKHLLSLPPLKSLTLSHITGISSNGLSSFATCINSAPLRRLDLRHTPLTSLPAVARLFSNLRSLNSFCLVQSFPPLMPETNSFVLWMMPYLASPSLKKIHWDITSRTASLNSADDILAKSIDSGGFPSLVTLRTPNDTYGAFQALCRPVEKIDLPTDRFFGTGMPSNQSFSAPSSPTFKLERSFTSHSLPATPLGAPCFGTDLVTARLLAQTRLEQARDKPRFQINIIDENSKLAETYAVAGYMGTVGSPIEYYLYPDEGSTDAQGGLVDVSDLMAGIGETLEDGKQGCTGKWNQREGIVADKKEKEKWWHTERGCWRKIEL